MRGRGGYCNAVVLWFSLTRCKTVSMTWMVAAFCLFASTPVFAYSTYSDVSYNGSMIYGYGVTDATNYSYTHDATVSVVLTSPNRSSGGGGTSSNSVTGYAYLSWDDNDLGDYTVTATHWAYCSVMGGYFIDAVVTSSYVNFGISYIVYHQPTKIGANCIYSMKSPCAVPCVQSEAIVWFGSAPCNPIEVISKPFMKSGTIYYCFEPHIFWAGNSSSTCWKIEI